MFCIPSWNVHFFQKNSHHSTFALDIYVKVKKINTEQQYYVTLRFNRWFVKMDENVGALKWMKITRDKHKPGNILNSRVWFHKKTITKWHEIYCNKEKIRFVSRLRFYRYIMVMRMLISLKKRYSSYLSAQPQMANAKNAYVPSSPVKSEYHCSKSLKCVNGTHTLVRYEKLWKSHAQCTSTCTLIWREYSLNNLSQWARKTKCAKNIFSPK